MSGYRGWWRTPVAAMTTSATSELPSDTSRCQRPPSNAIRVTSVPKRMRSWTPYSRATRSR